MSSLDATDALFIMGFIVLVSSGHASQYANISVSRLRYSANHNAPDSWPIRAHLASQNDELCFREAGLRGVTIMYSMWKIMCFLNLKPQTHCITPNTQCSF